MQITLLLIASVIAGCQTETPRIDGYFSALPMSGIRLRDPSGDDHIFILGQCTPDLKPGYIFAIGQRSTDPSGNSALYYHCTEQMECMFEGHIHFSKKIPDEFGPSNKPKWKSS